MNPSTCGKEISWILLIITCLAVGYCHDDQSEEKPDVTSLRPDGTSSPVTTNVSDTTDLVIDPNGYLLFCLCMGRFGNQLEHFLGGLEFAKQVNRTLVLPPFRTYINVPFSEWFVPSEISKYHRSVTAEEFFEKYVPTVWPPEERVGMCFEHPPGSGCELKLGNPFTNFWDELGVDFVRNQPMTTSYQNVRQWMGQMNGYKVVALKGAPASFPIQPSNIHLQKYLIYSDKFDQEILLWKIFAVDPLVFYNCKELSARVRQEAEELLIKHFGEVTQDYLAIHLRNNIDWERSCPAIEGTGYFNFMASYQCHKWNGDFKMNYKMCYQERDQVVEKVSKIVKEFGFKKVLIATDKYTFQDDIQKAVGSDVIVVHPDPWLPIVDTYLLTNSKYFIGNCVSSFSSFVRRHRDAHGLGTTDYFDDDVELNLLIHFTALSFILVLKSLKIYSF